MKLSAVVITHNEEENIARCLESLRFCGEIVVVDAESTDRTREIALKFTPSVHSLPWKGYSEQKNQANSLAAFDWILSVDADEVVSDELKEEIRGILAATPSEAGFLMPRKTIHNGQWIRYGGWYPNRLLRLFSKKQGRWVGSEVHERWETPGPVGSLQGHLIHYSFRDIADQIERNNRYSTLSAQRLFREGQRFSLPKMIFKPFSKFVETFIIKRGFLRSVSRIYHFGFRRLCRFFEMGKTLGVGAPW